MLQTPWSTLHLKQCNKLTGRPLIKDRSGLASANRDFGQLAFGQAVAVCEVHTLKQLQDFLHYAHQHTLPVTLRAQGLSQAGQSLTPPHTVSLNIRTLNTQMEWTSASTLRAGCSASFRDILQVTLAQNLIPPVYPYNTNLTLGGVLSVGGVGAASFREGILGAHVKSLRVVLADGSLVYCSAVERKELFDACLSGAGLFGVIYDAELVLRPACRRVTTVCLAYDHPALWLADQKRLPETVPYLESVCLLDADKKPEYLLFLSLEHENAVHLEFLASLHYRQCISTEETAITEYVNRHDGRFLAMKEKGLWNTCHPWYECYVSAQKLLQVWDRLMETIDLSLGAVYHVFPIGSPAPAWFMRPEEDDIVTFNILSAGILPDQLPQALASLSEIDTLLMELGGKRYLSGWFKDNLDARYWKMHYGDQWVSRKKLKANVDPRGIFCSHLFPRGLIA